MSYGYGYPTNNGFPPQQSQLPSPSFDPAVADTYNNGNGFAPIAVNTRGSNLFQSYSNSSSNNTPNGSSSQRPDYANGGPAAGRSCLVVPTFGSGKKKKKKIEKIKPSTPPRQPKTRSGGLFTRNSSSTESVSTSAESSMPDPYQIHHNSNDKQSLLKSFSKKERSGSKDAREWYLETMAEEDENADQETEYSNSKKSNSNSAHRPLQYQYGTPQQQQYEQHYPQFTPPPQQRETRGTSNPSPSTDVMPNLLQLPKAEDRSHEARGRQDKMHTYHGEMEPEGVRGQEAKVGTVNNSKSPHSSSLSPYLPNSNKQQPAMRNFTNPNSNNSESSSQLLPIREVVSNRQRQIQNSVRIPPTNHNHESNKAADFRKSPDRRKKSPSTIQARYSPGYKERMNVASNVLGGGRLPQRQQNDYSGYEEDIEHEQIISHNRAEFEREDKQDNGKHQGTQNTNLQQQQQLKHSANNEEKLASPSHNSIGSESLGSLETRSRTSRKSAPVNIDDASFEKPLEHIQGIHAMAMEHVADGEFDMALQAFKQVLKVYIKEHGEAHPLTASAHHNLGTVHTKRSGLLPDHTLHQRYCREQALYCFQAAARSARDCPSLGPNHPNVAVSLVRIGFLLLQARQYKNAIITFEEALRIRTENYGLHHGLVANLYNNLGVCHMHLQQFTEGQKDLQQALDIQKELLIEEGDNSSTAMLELADTLCNIGGLNLEWIRRQGPDARHAMDAESAFVEAQRLRTKVLGEGHVLTNQVRSLHDMVRSLPMPTTTVAVKKKPTAEKTSLNRAPPSWTSGHSSNSAAKMTFGEAFSPAAISDTTTSVGLEKTSNHDRSMAESMAESAAMNDANVPSIPVLKSPSNGSFYPEEKRLDNRNDKNNNFMDLYDATEENALLRKPGQEEGESSSQVGAFVTYARSTVSMGSESNHESERAATMRQAKEVLDSHQDFLNSPNQNRNNTSQDTERTIDDRDGNAYEDGLVPLAGDWPGPRDTNRLSPICLQNPTKNLHTIHNCAVSYMARGRHTEAVALLEMVAECQKQKNGTLNADVGSAVHNVGIAYLGAEVYYKAFQAFEEAVRIRNAALGRNHPVVAVSLVKFGISLMLLQRHEDSLWIFRDALAIRKEALGDLHPSNARIYNNIGCVHVELEQLDGARKAFESALDIQRNALIQNSENGPMIFGASTTLQNLGYLYGKRGMYEKAAMVLRESLSVSQNDCGWTSLGLPRCVH